MKPFDIELAKLGAAVCTRDGMPVRIICFDREEPNNEYPNPIITLEKDENGVERVNSYHRNGTYLVGNEPHDKDLMMAPIHHIAWTNIYKPCHLGDVYTSEKEAKKVGSKNNTYIATVKIEWDE